jgi:DNA-binding MarR family transcriptional regulator
MDRSTITRNIHPLVNQRMLQVSGKSGRGGKSVEITKEGQQALISALPYWKEAQGQLLNRMGKDRLERVMVDLSNVVDASRATS